MSFSVLGVVSVAAGAIIGSCLRWGLGITMNAINASIPLGTLIANFVGAYLIGLIIEFLSFNQSVPPYVKLMLVTGLLGSLTTFSTFSMEAVTLIFRQQFLAVFIHINLHVFGCLLLTVLGVFSARYMYSLVT